MPGRYLALAGMPPISLIYGGARAGTPMQGNKPPAATDIVRCVATARVTMPRSVVRLSAGRLNFSLSDQVRKVQLLQFVQLRYQCLLWHSVHHVSCALQMTYLKSRDDS